MAFYNDQWFIHAVSDNVTQLAQQKQSKVMGAVRTRENVIGKTWPFQTIGQITMQPHVRDGATMYLNPFQGKRRAVLTDFDAFVLVDTFDQVKELANPQSEFAQILANSRNRRLDDFVLSPTGATIGGAIGTATTVDEAAETTSTQAMLAANQVAAGGTSLTLAKVRSAKLILDSSDVDEDERYFFYSPKAMQQGLMLDSQATSSDFNTIRVLNQGMFPQDATWYGFKWRQTTRLPLSSTTRSCIAFQKQAVALAIGVMTEVEIDKAVHMRNNIQVGIKLSAGCVRVDDLGVVQVDVTES